MGPIEKTGKESTLRESEPERFEEEDPYEEEEDEAGTGDPTYHHRRTRDSQRLRALGTAGAPMAYIEALKTRR